MLDGSQVINSGDARLRGCEQEEWGDVTPVEQGHFSLCHWQVMYLYTNNRINNSGARLWADWTQETQGSKWGLSACACHGPANCYLRQQGLKTSKGLSRTRDGFGALGL